MTMKKVLPLALLAILAVYAVAAQSASAVTWYECVPNAKPGIFKDAHCKEKTFPTEGWVHVELPTNQWIPVVWTNETTGGSRATFKLKSVQSGVTLELQATEVEGEGEVQNKNEGEKSFWGEGKGKVTYKHTTITAPAGKGCKVKGEGGEVETVTTKELVATTVGVPEGEIKFAPATGTVFAEFTVEGCSISALNHVYTVTGSIIGTGNGTTTVLTHEGTTKQGTLSVFGQKAGIEATTTLKRRSTGNGIALT
jgi:hypothetical protein